MAELHMQAGCTSQGGSLVTGRVPVNAVAPNELVSPPPTEKMLHGMATGVGVAGLDRYLPLCLAENQHVKSGS